MAISWFPSCPGQDWLRSEALSGRPSADPRAKSGETRRGEDKAIRPKPHRSLSSSLRASIWLLFPLSLHLCLFSFFPLSFSSPRVSPSVSLSQSLSFFSNHKTWLNAISIECKILCLWFIILSGFVHVFNCIIPLLPHFLPKTFSHII